MQKTSWMRGENAERKIRFKAEKRGTSRRLMWLSHPLVDGDQTSGSCTILRICYSLLFSGHPAREKFPP